MDKMLSRYSVVILDEVHERSLDTDILLTLMHEIAKVRPDFRLILSTATLDQESFLSFFD